MATEEPAEAAERILAARDSGNGPLAVLGLPEGFREEEARCKFRQLARVLHPDKRGGGGGREDEAFKALEEAKRELFERSNRGWGEAKSQQEPAWWREFSGGERTRGAAADEGEVEAAVARWSAGPRPFSEAPACGSQAARESRTRGGEGETKLAWQEGEEAFRAPLLAGREGPTHEKPGRRGKRRKRQKLVRAGEARERRAKAARSSRQLPLKASLP